MKTEFYPQIEDAQRVPCHQSVGQVKVFDREVAVERLWGRVPAGKPFAGCHCRVTRTYENVSLASLQRVHKAVTHLVNKGQANIHLSQVGAWGLGYEMEYR